MEDMVTQMCLKNIRKLKRPQGRRNLVFHKVAWWVEVDLKCASGEVTSESGMARSVITPKPK